MSNDNEELPVQPQLEGNETERIHDAFSYGEPAKKTIAEKAAVVVDKPVETSKGSESPKKGFVPFKKNSDDLDFLKYIAVIVRRRRILLLAVLGFILLGLFRNIGRVDQYQAETKLLIQLKQQNPVGQFDPGYFWDRQTKINTMLNTLKSREVLQRVLDRLEMHLTPVALGSRISALRVQETNIIKVTAVSEIPEEAALVANTLAQVFV